MKLKLVPTALALALGASVFAQTQWNQPTAYPACSFHTENITQFAKEVDADTSGKLKIEAQANALQFKAPGGHYNLDSVIDLSHIGCWLLLAATVDELFTLLKCGKPSYQRALEERHAKGDFSSDIWLPVAAQCI